MSVTIQGKSLKATPDAFATMSVFSAPAPFSHSGVLKGYDPISRMLVWIDLPKMQNDGITNGQIGQYIAPRRHGKSASMKADGFRYLGLQVGRDGSGYPRLARVEANDRKPEGKKGQGEWTAFGRAAAAEFVVVSEMPNLNLFHEEMMFSEAQIHEIAIKVGEFAANQLLTATERWVMLVATRKMMNTEFRTIAGTDTLAFLLSTLTAEDRDEYFRDSDARLMENHADVLIHSPKLAEEIKFLRSRMLEPLTGMDKRERAAAQAEFLEAARHLTTYMGNAMEGEFGGVIGGKHSPLQMLRSHRRVIDWTGTSRNTQGILEFFFSVADQHALKHPELGITPDIRFSDEDRSADSEIYLRTRLERIEKARAIPTEEWSSVQYEKGIEMTIGDVGTAKRGLAKLIDLGIAVRFLGKQPNNRDFLEKLGDTYNIPEHILYYSPRLQTGDWLVWTNGSREVRLVRQFMTPGELYAAMSDSATEDKLDRAHIINELGYVPAIATDEFIQWMLANRRSYNINPQD